MEEKNEEALLSVEDIKDTLERIKVTDVDTLNSNAKNSSSISLDILKQCAEYLGIKKSLKKSE
jgi:peptide deformylase